MQETTFLSVWQDQRRGVYTHILGTGVLLPFYRADGDAFTVKMSFSNDLEKANIYIIACSVCLRYTPINIS